MDIVRVQHGDHHTRVNDGQRDSSRSLSNAPRGHNPGNAPDKLVELVVDPATMMRPGPSSHVALAPYPLFFLA